jgi:DNA/RNA endonuclease G (NUC1)/polyhydroxyalkanoate synthesis regulator phasin
MRIRTWSAALVAVALTATSCSENGIVNPGKTGPDRIRIDVLSGVAKVVISQIYGAGGNSGAVLQNDYVELFNAGTASQDLTGWSVQYGSATGTGNLGVTNQIAALSGSVAPGQYYLVKLAGGTVGAAVPTADATSNINMAGGAGKVALVDQATTIGCNGGSNPCSAAQLAHIIDLVGYGTGASGANFFEGAGPAPTISATLADFRADNGCTDTNVNSADFATAAPAPRNSSTALAPCGGVIVVAGPLDHIVVTGGTSVNVGSEITLTAELQDVDNHTIVDAAATFTWLSADDATLHLVSTTGNSATFRGLQPGGPVAITVTATSNAVTKTADPSPTLTVTGVATIVPSTTFVSEIHYDNTGTDAGEAMEIEGAAGSSLDGWSLVMYNGTTGSATLGVYATVPLSGLIPATCGTRGVVVVPFPVNGIQNGDADGWALINALGQVTELKSYEGTFTATGGPAAGLTSTAIEADESTAPVVGRSVQRAGNGVWFGPRTNTFGACNPALPLGPQGSVTVTSGKTELAFAMQTQFFFGGTDLTGQPVTSVVWSTSNPAIVTVDQKGVVTAKGVGTAQLIATAPDGAIGTVDMTVYVAAGSTGIRLGHNTEFGEPRDADLSDDFLIRRPQYTVSYNPRRGGANWVSWNLDVSHIGDNGRCPGTCYSADTALSNAGLPAYTTADWVSGATYDRGHMAPSADWTSSEADNNTTFFLSNFVPQRPDLNQGPWEKLEEALRDSVSGGTREGYIIAGGIFTHGVGLGTLLDLGKIAIPDSTWKIAVFTPAGAGLNADGTLPANTTVMVVNMPNVQGIRDADWHTYLTTVAKIEQSTGYNFLALITESVQCRVEHRNCAPIAHITVGGGQINEGQTVAFSSATSTDPDGDVLTMAWTINGVSAGTGETLNSTFAQDGIYAVRLIVSDNLGAADTTSTTVNVLNVAPAISALPAATLLPGETYNANGSFSDPGADAWTATVNYGDGAGAQTLPLSGMAFALSHRYLASGSFTVAVQVSDDDVTSTRTQIVTVLSESQGLDQVAAAIANLVGSGKLSSKDARKLVDDLDDARKELGRGRGSPSHAEDKLKQLLDDVDDLIRSRRLSASDAAPLQSILGRVIHSLSLQDDDDRRDHGRDHDNRHDDNEKYNDKH